VVTGTSGEIAAAARALAARGFAICINNAKSGSVAQRVCSDIVERVRRAHVVQADMARESDFIEMFEQVDRHLGRLGGLANNATYVGTAAQRIDAAETAVLQATFNVNVVGHYVVCA